jgi:aminoglycoside phosphotransferase (APT) family kinase protein
LSGDKHDLGLRSSQRDPATLREQLGPWLRDRRPGAVLRAVTIPERTGISSLSAMLELEDGGRLVARIAPEAAAVPVFPTYDLAKQFAVIELVAAGSAAPVPAPLWHEADTGVVGSEFFVMEHVDGLVPPDVMPYTFGSWLSEAAPASQRALQDAAVEALAQVHGVPLDAGGRALLDAPGEGSPLRRHVDGLRAYYRWCAEAGDGAGVPVLDAGLDWLEAEWPADEGEPVLSWGDARIGNMIFRDFRPVALLDWEMAGVAPREVDLGWMIYLHRFLDDIAETFAIPPMRGFMRVGDVVERYRAASGADVSASLRWYLFYAALRHGAIMFRVTTRQIAFGEAAMPADRDGLVLHHETLRKMMDGSYWPGFDSSGAG